MGEIAQNTQKKALRPFYPPRTSNQYFSLLPWFPRVERSFHLYNVVEEHKMKGGWERRAGDIKQEQDNSRSLAFRRAQIARCLGMTGMSCDSNCGIVLRSARKSFWMDKRKAKCRSFATLKMTGIGFRAQGEAELRVEVGGPSTGSGQTLRQITQDEQAAALHTDVDSRMCYEGESLPHYSG
jgi:hypothetical protein